MSKGPRSMSTRRGSSGKRRRGRKRRQYERRPVQPLAPGVASEARAPLASAAPPKAPSAQQTALLYPSLLRDIKRSGLIAGGLLILLIVLSLIL